MKNTEKEISVSDAKLLPVTPSDKSLEFIRSYSPPSTFFSLISLVFSVTSICMLWLILHTCSSGPQCYPQYKVQIRDHSAKARQFLDSGREGLNMISYLANDLSPALNDNASLLAQNKSAYLDVIDTLSTDNIYLLSFGGYCRHHSIIGKRTCSHIAGLDVALVFVKDIGDQLGGISQTENSKELGSYFLTTYRGALRELESIWCKRRQSVLVEHYHWRTLTIAHRLLQLHTFAKTMVILCRSLLVVTAVSSGFIWLICLFSKCSIIAYLNIDHWLYLSTLILLVAQVILALSLVISESVIVNCASKLANRIAIARITFGPGIYIMGTTILATILNIVFITRTLRKRA